MRADDMGLLVSQSVILPRKGLGGGAKLNHLVEIHGMVTYDHFHQAGKMVEGMIL